MLKVELGTLIISTLLFSTVFANSYKTVSKYGSNYLDLSGLVSSGLVIAVKNPKTGEVTYTHNGVFIKRDGYYYQNNSNLRLQGYPIPTQLTDDACTLGDIKAAANELAPQATTSYEVILNLDSSANIPVNLFNPADISSFNYYIESLLFDKSGKEHTMQSYFVKTTVNDYDLHVLVDGVEIDRGHVEFNSVGNLVNSDLDEIQFQVKNTLQKVSYSIKGSTQFAQPYHIFAVKADGHGHADFIEEDVDPNGNLFAEYSRVILPLGKIAIFYR